LRYLPRADPRLRRQGARDRSRWWPRAEGRQHRRAPAEQIPARQRVNIPSTLGRMFVAIFLGALVAGYLAMLAFSASGCFLSHVIRCFSISRDLMKFSWFALKGLSLPAVVTALLVTMILQIRGVVAGWNVLVASLLSAFVFGLIDRVPFLSGEVL